MSNPLSRHSQGLVTECMEQFEDTPDGGCAGVVGRRQLGNGLLADMVAVVNALLFELGGNPQKGNHHLGKVTDRSDNALARRADGGARCLLLFFPMF